MLANAAHDQRETKLFDIPVSRQSWVVCLSAALFFFYEFIQLGMFNSISPDLMNTFKVNATQLGNISAMYFYGDVAFLFFAGMLLDRFSTRKIIIGAMLLCIIATIIFALSPSILIASMSHLAAGIGNAFCFLSCIKLITRWFAPRRTALMIGLTVTIAMAGGVFAQTPLTLLTQALGWRNAVLMDALLGMIILAIIWRNVFDGPQTEVSVREISRSSKNFVKFSVRFAFVNAQNWLAGFYTCFLNLPIFLLGDLWGVMYLTQTDNISRMQASYITTMVFVGTILGSPLVGIISDRLGQRRLPMIWGAILSLTVMLIIMFVPHLTFWPLLFLFLLLGIFTSTQIISYPLIAESNPKAMTGTAAGLASILIMGGGAVFQPLFGWLMDLHGKGIVHDGIVIYTHADFFRGMMIMPIAFIIGLAAALLMRETYCRPHAINGNGDFEIK